MKVLKEDKDFNQQSFESPVEGLLEGEAVLCRKTSAADCKIEDPELYDRHLRRLNEMIGNVAERMRPNGVASPATKGSHVNLIHLTRRSGYANCSQGVAKELFLEHHIIISILRDVILPFADEFSDKVTSDFFAGLLESHEKIAMVLDARMNE